MRFDFQQNPELGNVLLKNKYDIASTIYAEMRNRDKKYWNMVLSSIINRVGRREWRNMPVSEILSTGFSAVNDTSVNKGWEHAQAGKFPDKESENKFKKIWAFTSRALAGDIDLYDNQFYFTPKEERQMVENDSFDFSQVEKTGRVGNFNLYSYK